MNSPASQIQAYLPLLVAGMSFLVGLAVAASGLRPFLRARASANWPTADGAIVQSEVVPGGEGTHAPKIVYEYLVHGQRFTGNQLKAGHKNLGASGDHARTCVERYPVGTRVKIFHDPDRPEQCALEPGVGFASCVLLIAGLGTALIAAPIEYLVVSRKFLH